MGLDVKPLQRQHLQPTRPAMLRSDIDIIDATKTGWVKRPVLLSLLVRVAAVNAELLTKNCAFLHGFGVICLKLARYLLAAGALLAY